MVQVSTATPSVINCNCSPPTTPRALTIISELLPPPEDALVMVKSSMTTMPLEGAITWITADVLLIVTLPSLGGVLGVPFCSYTRT